MILASLRVSALLLVIAALASTACRDSGKALRSVEEMQLVPDGTRLVKDRLVPGGVGSGNAWYSRFYRTEKSEAEVIAFYDEALSNRGWVVVGGPVASEPLREKVWAKGDLSFQLTLGTAFRDDQPTLGPYPFEIVVSKKKGG
ncbi:MAG: hypothetical protein ACKVT1_02580 [Dehalococcoidia bacterium]